MFRLVASTYCTAISSCCLTTTLPFSPLSLFLSHSLSFSLSASPSLIVKNYSHNFWPLTRQLALENLWHFGTFSLMLPACCSFRMAPYPSRTPFLSLSHSVFLCSLLHTSGALNAYFKLLWRAASAAHFWLIGKFIY